MSLIVVGSVAFDAIETPQGKTGKILGGAGTYISISASYFGVSPKIISVVGGDFPQEYIDILKKYNVVLDGFQIKPDKKTFFWSGKYHENMNIRDTLLTELNVLSDFDPIVPDSYQDCNYLMLGNLAPDIQRKVIERLHRRPKLIVMDTMNFWMQIAFDELIKTIGMVDVLTINDEEARMLSRESYLLTAARKIMEMGPKYLIIKKGEHGALLFGEGKVFCAPATLLENVIDPTGAGDSFAGGFIGYIAKHRDITFDNMKRAVMYGSALGSFCVEKFGTENIMSLNDSDIERRIQEIVDFTRF